MTTFGKSMSIGDRSRDVNEGATKNLRNVKLPQTFVVKYLGHEEAQGLWGIKNTRKPVDDMVEVARKMKNGSSLPFLQMKVSEKGVLITEMPQNVNKNFPGGFYSVECISYGVQDLVYTRVFAMIVVAEDAAKNPFRCHAFVCESRQVAKNLTFALATAFQAFSNEMKAQGKKGRKFAIDLRSPEEIEAGEQEETEA